MSKYDDLLNKFIDAVIHSDKDADKEIADLTATIEDLEKE